MAVESDRSQGSFTLALSGIFLVGGVAAVGGFYEVHDIADQQNTIVQNSPSCDQVGTDYHSIQNDAKVKLNFSQVDDPLQAMQDALSTPSFRDLVHCAKDTQLQTRTIGVDSDSTRSYLSAVSAFVGSSASLISMLVLTPAIYRKLLRI